MPDLHVLFDDKFVVVEPGTSSGTVATSEDTSGARAQVLSRSRTAKVPSKVARRSLRASAAFVEAYQDCVPAVCRAFPRSR